MVQRHFDYGPFWRAIYISMIWLTPVVLLYWQHLFWKYLMLLFFLGVVLRPLLQLTGILNLVEAFQMGFIDFIERSWKKRLNRKIDQKIRDDRYRKMKRKRSDPKLPPNW